MGYQQIWSYWWMGVTSTFYCNSFVREVREASNSINAWGIVAQIRLLCNRNIFVGADCAKFLLKIMFSSIWHWSIIERREACTTYSQRLTMNPAATLVVANLMVTSRGFFISPWKWFDYIHLDVIFIISTWKCFYDGSKTWHSWSIAADMWKRQLRVAILGNCFGGCGGAFILPSTHSYRIL